MIESLSYVHHTRKTPAAAVALQVKVLIYKMPFD